MNRIRRLETLESLVQVGPHHIDHWSNETPIDGTPQIFIPDGYQDVTAVLGILFVVERITAGLFNSGGAAMAPGGTFNLYNVAGNILRVSVTAGGEASIAVAGGVDTYNVSMLSLWI